MIAYNKIWSLFTGLIETNMSKIVFYGCIQFLVLGYFDFVDKLNIVLDCILLFVWLAYCLLFYPLIYKYEGKKPGETILSHSLYSLTAFYM